MFKPTQEFLSLPMLPYYAQALNTYFLRDESPIEIPKPTGSVPNIVARAIRYAEENKVDGWLQFAFDLLDLWNEQQLILSRLIEGAWTGKGSKSFGPVKFECIRVSTEGEGDISFCAATGISIENSSSLASEIIRIDNVSSVFIFGCGTDNPFAFVQVFWKNPSSV